MEAKELNEIQISAMHHPPPFIRTSPPVDVLDGHSDEKHLSLLVDYKVLLKDCRVQHCSLLKQCWHFVALLLMLLYHSALQQRNGQSGLGKGTHVTKQEEFC